VIAHALILSRYHPLGLTYATSTVTMRQRRRLVADYRGDRHAGHAADRRVALRRVSPLTPDAMLRGDSLPFVERHMKLFKSFLLCSAFVWMPSRVNICAVRRKTAADDAVLWMRIDAKRPIWVLR
jgi:hypothetical protein